MSVPNNTPINLTEAIRLANDATHNKAMLSSEKVVVYENAIQILLDAVDRLEAVKAEEMKRALEYVRRKSPPTNPV